MSKPRYDRINDKREREYPMTKPTCEIIGTDGNVFAVIARVSRTLQRAGQREKADEWATEAMKCASYDEVLRLMFEYVEPE